MTKTIAFINHKGGVGKTTVCAHLAYSLTHHHSKRVLAVDFDTQANLTEILGVMQAPRTIADVLGGDSAESCIYDVNGISVLTSSMELANTEYELTANNTQNALKTALEGIATVYDYVLIDCPPSLGMLTMNAMIAASDVCVVSNAEYLSLRGMANIVSVITQMRMYNPRLELSSVVVSHYDTRKSVNREVLEQLRETFAGRVISPPVRTAVAVVEASSHGGTVFQVRPSADVTNDFNALSTSFLNHYEKQTR
jgi:chromosome partitioning protein